MGEHDRGYLGKKTTGVNDANCALQSTINGLVEEFFHMLGDGEVGSVDCSSYSFNSLNQNQYSYTMRGLCRSKWTGYNPSFVQLSGF